MITLALFLFGLVAFFTGRTRLGLYLLASGIGLYVVSNVLIGYLLADKK